MSLEWEIDWIEYIYERDRARQGIWPMFSFKSLNFLSFFHL